MGLNDDLFINILCPSQSTYRSVAARGHHAHTITALPDHGKPLWKTKRELPITGYALFLAVALGSVIQDAAVRLPVVHAWSFLWVHTPLTAQ